VFVMPNLTAKYPAVKKNPIPAKRYIPILKDFLNRC